MSNRKRTKPLYFTYPKGYFVKDALYYVILVLIPLFIFTLLKPPIIWIIPFLVLFIVFLIVFGLSPMVTSHLLMKRRLILRQGLYFKLMVRLRDIESVDYLDSPGILKKGKLGLKSEWGKPRLYVTSSQKELISIKLKKPRYIPYIIGIVGKVIDEVVTNVNESDKFIRLVRERTLESEKSPPIKTVVRK